MYTTKRALVLDIDGTVRRSKSGQTFIQDKDDIEIIPGIYEKIVYYKDSGYLILGISNQGGIAYGYRTKEEVEKEMAVTYHLLKDSFNNIIYSPFMEGGNNPEYSFYSLSRKPNIGMLAFLEKHYYKQEDTIIDWKNSLYVGDRDDDKKCAANAGISYLDINDFLSIKLVNKDGR